MKIIAEFNSIEEVKEFSKAFKANEIIIPPIQINNDTDNALVETKKSEDSEIKKETKTKQRKYLRKKKKKQLKKM